MRIGDIIERTQPRLTRLHYYGVDDEQAAEQLGMRQDRRGQWYMSEYTTSGRLYQQRRTQADRIFGRPVRTVEVSQR